MAQTNCIVLDNRYTLSLDSKIIKAPDGTTIAVLYHINIDKLTEADLIELAIQFSQTYELAQKRAKEDIAKNISKIFGLTP